MIRSSAIREHARGQQCQIRLPGICCGDSETTVFCHLNDSAFGKGMSQKATDLAGFHGCRTCHAYVDVGHGTHPQMSDAELDKAMLVAVVRTWTLLVNDGVLALKVDKPKTHKPSTRKPRNQRAKIHGSREIPQRPKRPAKPQHSATTPIPKARIGYVSPEEVE